jgi:GH25 family lysozyme M1 (1,4-beta-N-acetylmuramidase)
MTLPTVFRAGRQQQVLPDVGDVAAAAPLTYLADVSEYQPDLVDATYLKWSLAVVIRALYGAAHDDAAWYNGTRRSALHKGGAKFVGIYQYLLPSATGAAHAQAFHKLVGAIKGGEVFIADAEAITHAELSSWYNTMISLYGKAITPYLWTYTGVAWGQEQGLLPVEWIAAYQATEPSTPHKLWQFSESYSVPGIAGKCDCSVFHGTITQLAALAHPAA